MHKKHPSWTNKQIGDTQLVSAATAGRIISGVHPICKELK